MVRKPTLKTIAAISGFGVPTVSRALNGSAEIGEETKRLIRNIADEIGYVRDSSGLRLRTGKTNIVNLILSMHRDDRTGELVSSFAQSLQATPFQVVVAPLMPREDPLAAVRRVVESQMADGIIINETLIEDPRITYLLDRKFPFAVHGRDRQAHLYPHYDYDNRAFGQMAVELLYNRGRRSLALFGPPRTRNYGHETYVGADMASAQLGVDLRPVESTTSEQAVDILMAGADAFVANHPECDGYVCSSFDSAMAITAALEKIRRVVGQDVDVVAKGASAFLRMMRPGILIFDESISAVGEFLGKALLQAIRFPELPPMHKLEKPVAPMVLRAP